MRILYLEGDDCAPKYVQGSLERLGHEVTPVVAKAVPDGTDPADHDLCLMSDFPVKKLSDEASGRIVDAVRSGVGLVMVGGWTSFGRGGYARHPIARLLPVHLKDGDDRENAPSGAFLHATSQHDIVSGLDFRRPPVITGWNALEPREEGDVVLVARRVSHVWQDHAALAEESQPILVSWTHDNGARVSALATDLAPHWSGGWTDWGDERYDVGQGEEVGGSYLRFLDQLCAWTAGKQVAPREREMRLR